MCPDCRRTFTTGHGLQVHRRRIHNTGPTEPAPGRVRCEHCGVQISSGNLGRHIARHHADRPASVVEHRCEVCGRVFATGSGLGGHRRAHKPRKKDTAPAAALVEPPAWPSSLTIAPVADAIGKTDFDADGARHAAADALHADNAGVTVKPADTGFTAPAKSKPTRFCSTGCGTILSLYNETGRCSACDSAAARFPLGARNAG